MADTTQDDDKTIIRPRARTEAVGNALPSGTILGEFELTAVLGEGGFGIVYTGWDRSLERKVAVKEYMPSSLAARADQSRVEVRSERHRETFELGLRSFVNEAKMLAQFDHPALVKVYRFWEQNGTAYMVMPLYEGTTLKDLLKTLPRPLAEDWLLGLLAPLTAALQVLHRESCFHRDIAPDNIMLLGGERPLLLDFGAARKVISDKEQALTVILKPGYAPVEQYAEVPEMRQGAWTDVYALAASMHFAMTGETPPAAVGRMVNDRYQPLAQRLAGQYSPRLLQALDRALAVHPEQRTQDMAALRQDLGLEDHPGNTAATGSGAAGRPTPAARPKAAAQPAPARSGTNRLPLLIGSGVTLAAAAGVTFWLTTPSAPAIPPGPGPAIASAVPATAPPAVQAPASMPGTAAPGTEPAGASMTAPPPATGTAVTGGAAGAASATSNADANMPAEFAKVLAGAQPAFAVQASADKPVLHIGKDNLGFSVKSARDGFLQIVLLDPAGKLYLFYPNDKAPNNRIKAGQSLHLPGPSWPLETTDLGRESFLVMVTESARDYRDLLKGKEYIFGVLPAGADGNAAVSAWKLSSPLLLGAPKGCTGAACDTYGAATFDVEAIR